MAAGEGEQEKKDAKGFAGIALLVSDPDAMAMPATRQAAPGSPLRISRPAPAEPEPEPEPEPAGHQAYPQPEPPPEDPFNGQRIFGIAALIGVLWFIAQLATPTPSAVPASSPPVQSEASAYSPPVQSAAPAYAAPVQPQTPAAPEESLPPVGKNLFFSTAQIRYCLAEEIRISGASSAVNKYIESDVGLFNAMVDDFNSRCASFRYSRGALESARRDIEPHRSLLHLEGRNRFARKPFAGLPSIPQPPSSRTAAVATLSGHSSPAQQSAGLSAHACMVGLVVSNGYGAEDLRRVGDKRIQRFPQEVSDTHMQVAMSSSGAKNGII